MNKRKNTQLIKFPHKCVCCGEGTINDAHDICLVCGWEDDEVQNEEADFAGGANRESLNMHKKIFEEMRNQKKDYLWCNNWKR